MFIVQRAFKKGKPEAGETGTQAIEGNSPKVRYRKSMSGRPFRSRCIHWQLRQERKAINARTSCNI